MPSAGLLVWHFSSKKTVANSFVETRDYAECWDRDWRLRPRNFIDVSNVDLSAEVLGHRLSVPIMAAPTALLKMGHEDGEVFTTLSPYTVFCLSYPCGLDHLTFTTHSM